MNVVAQAQKMYAPVSNATRTPRAQEYEVIARITKRLKQAIKSRDRIKLIESLHENRMLWTTLAVTVADPDNALPDEVRAQFIYLAEFTDQHTSKVLKKEANPVILLEINISILRGLRMEGDPS